ncbi:hypothetical protein BEWA_038530 [Theileria equi strain WA]|uniref:Uncharacterized protein n=1 Tax=Theileria equi strain WA TaxID=1537102 RepID=L1LEQ5_THEEQ|nr:hypothetical protein BEWA_038530 [Theileria equi strain WA]EKX73816.1 hypothetical protein BEWA_038530 [Theileria equi strain WA]|eukprot:XP_004833268.1 hypothetical protein BEWA_038530 [Theileria equi strain WA]
MASLNVNLAAGTHIFVQSKSEVWTRAVVEKVEGDAITAKIVQDELNKDVEGDGIVMLKSDDLFYPHSVGKSA